MKKFLFAGMGGQGILSMGRFWTESGLIEGKEVSYLPAYGPEMRGGTANCAVIISRTPIASPLCAKPDVLIAMNAPSLHRFAKNVVPNGLILINGNLSDGFSGRDDVRSLVLMANDLAHVAGDVRSANMVMTGALCALTGAVSERSILACLHEKFAAKPNLIGINEKAFRLGLAAADEGLKK